MSCCISKANIEIPWKIGSKSYHNLKQLIEDKHPAWIDAFPNPGEVHRYENDITNDDKICWLGVKDKILSEF